MSDESREATSAITPASVRGHSDGQKFRRHLQGIHQSAGHRTFHPQKYVDNVFEAKDADFQPARQRVYRSRRFPSHLELQVLKAS